ncbi:MAG: O-antigen ligase family protein [Pseudomonadota bacterium]
MAAGVASKRWMALVTLAGTPVLLLLAALGFAFFYGPSYNLAFLFAGIAALLALIGLCGPAAAAQAAAGSPFASSAALLTLVCLTGQHALASTSPETSIAGAWLLAAGPISYLAFASLGERLRVLDRRIEWGLALPWALVWLACGIAAHRLLTTGQRPYDPLSDASALACLLYLAWVPWMHDVLREGARGQPRFLAVMAASLLLLLVLFATGSRAGTGLAVIALVCWLGLACAGRLPLRRVLVLISAAAVAALIAYQASTSLQKSLAESVVTDPSTSERLLLLTAALDAYAQGSIHGTGPLTFSLFYGALRSTEDQTSGGSFVHNDYLQLLVEGGPWLLWPLLLLGFVCGVQLLLGLLRPQSSWRLGRLGGWLALTLACAHALVNFIVYTPTLAFAMGGILAWTLYPPGNTTVSAPPSRRARVSWSLLLFIGLVLLAGFLVEVMALAVFAGQQDLFGSARYRSSPQAQLAFARATTAVLPERGLPWLMLALSAERDGRLAAQRGAIGDMVNHFNDALAEFRKARIADPWNTDALERYARFLALRQSEAVQRLLPAPPMPSGLVALQENEDPESLLLDALRRNPRALSTLAALVGLYDQQGRSVESYERIKAHFGRWMRNHVDRQPQLARQWFAEFERRALEAGDTDWVERARVQQGRLGGVGETPPPRVWFKRWRQSRQPKGAGG